MLSRQLWASVFQVLVKMEGRVKRMASHINVHVLLASKEVTVKVCCNSTFGIKDKLLFLWRRPNSSPHIQVPWEGRFERYACKPFFSVKLETVVMNPWNSSFFFAGTCTYVFVCKPLLSINIGCQSENTRTDLSSEGLNGFLIVSRTYYFQVNNW